MSLGAGGFANVSKCTERVVENRKTLEEPHEHKPNNSSEYPAEKSPDLRLWQVNQQLERIKRSNLVCLTG